MRKIIDAINPANLEMWWHRIRGYVLYKHKFMRWGKRAAIWYPDRIVGSKYMSIGDNVYILHHARLETVQHKNGMHGRLEIGDGTSIEERCHIIAGGVMRIGKDCVISADVYISDCNHGYSRKDKIMSQALEVKETTIGNHCFIGIGAKIMPGVTIGDYSVIGAQAVVTHNVPEGGIVAGVPAKLIGFNE